MEEGKLLADTGKQINRLYFMMYKYHSPKNLLVDDLCIQI
jgi:hypothetical protein